VRTYASPFDEPTPITIEKKAENLPRPKRAVSEAISKKNTPHNTATDCSGLLELYSPNSVVKINFKWRPYPYFPNRFLSLSKFSEKFGKSGWKNKESSFVSGSNPIYWFHLNFLRYCQLVFYFSCFRQGYSFSNNFRKVGFTICDMSPWPFDSQWAPYSVWVSYRLLSLFVFQ